MKYSLAFILLLTLAYLKVVKCDWWSDQIGGACDSYPRVRLSWCALTYKQRATWIAITRLMRNTKIPGYSDNYYKAFVDIHSVACNSNPSHGTSIFTLWHRAFVYHVESCYRFFAYQNRVQLSLSVDEACSVSLPYWPWEVDYDSNSTDSYIPQDHSCIWDYPELFGPAPTHPSPISIPTGPFCASNWTTNLAINDNPINYTNAHYGPLTNVLRRQFNVQYNFIIGPAQMMQSMVSTPYYTKWGASLEGGPHSYVHLWLGYDMRDMRSPEEPLFFLHHGNIERLNTMYQDCWDYEFLNPEELTTMHYNASNPSPWPYPFSPAYYKRDLLGNICNVGIDNPMNYWWKAYMIGTSTTYTYVDAPWMKNGTFPSPRNNYLVCFPGQPCNGYLNMTYIYPNDTLVNTLGKACTKNTVWTYFPATAPPPTISKRDVVETSKVSNIERSQSNTAVVYDRLTEQMSEMKKKGLCITDALEALAIQECQEAGVQSFPPDMDSWMKMNGLVPSQFTRICEGGDYSSDSGVVYSTIQDASTYYRPVNTIVAIAASVSGIVLLILIIIGVIILVRRSKAKKSNVPDTYLNL